LGSFTVRRRSPPKIKKITIDKIEFLVLPVMSPITANNNGPRILANFEEIAKKPKYSDALSWGIKFE